MGSRCPLPVGLKDAKSVGVVRSILTSRPDLFRVNDDGPVEGPHQVATSMVYEAHSWLASSHMEQGFGKPEECFASCIAEKDRECSTQERRQHLGKPAYLTLRDSDADGLLPPSNEALTLSAGLTGSRHKGAPPATPPSIISPKASRLFTNSDKELKARIFKMNSAKQILSTINSCTNPHPWLLSMALHRLAKTHDVQKEDRDLVKLVDDIAAVYAKNGADLSWPRTVGTLASALVRIGIRSRGAESVRESIVQVLVHQSHTFGVRELATVVWALGKAAANGAFAASTELVEAVVKRTTDIVSFMSPIDMANVIWALAKFKDAFTAKGAAAMLERFQAAACAAIGQFNMQYVPSAPSHQHSDALPASSPPTPFFLPRVQGYLKCVDGLLGSGRPEDSPEVQAQQHANARAVVRANLRSLCTRDSEAPRDAGRCEPVGAHVVVCVVYAELDRSGANFANRPDGIPRSPRHVCRRCNAEPLSTVTGDSQNVPAATVGRRSRSDDDILCLR